MPPVTRSRQCNIVTGSPGPTRATDVPTTMYEVFNMFLDDEIVDTIRTFTNAEASRVVQELNANAAPNRMRIWIDVDPVEIRAFFGVLLIAGALRCRKETILKCGIQMKPFAVQFLLLPWHGTDLRTFFSSSGLTINQHVFNERQMINLQLYVRFGIIIIIIIIIIGTTAPFEPRPSSEASASCPYCLQHSSNFSPPTSWHLPSHHLPISVSACPSVFFLLPLQRELFL